MVSPMASDRLGWAWISRPTSRQRLPVDRQVALVQQLAGPRPDEVEAQDRPVLLRDDLHQAVGLAEDHGPPVAGERVLVHDDVVARLPGLPPRSCPTTRPRGGCRRPTAPRRSRPAPGCRPGSGRPRAPPRRRRRAPGPVCATQSPIAYTPGREVEHGVRVDLDEPALVDPHARPPRAPIALADRAAADRDQHLVDLDLLRALRRLERHDHAVVGVLERADPRLGVDLGAALLQRLGQHVGHVAVGPDRQHTVAHRLQQRGVARRDRCRPRRTRPRSRRRRSPRPARAASSRGVCWSTGPR